jgi:hypothetical protein
VPPGALLSLMQKGLYYTEAELSIGDVSLNRCRAILYIKSSHKSPVLFRVII